LGKEVSVFYSLEVDAGSAGVALREAGQRELGELADAKKL
jgi:hypothetical protein